MILTSELAKRLNRIKDIPDTYSKLNTPITTTNISTNYELSIKEPVIIKKYKDGKVSELHLFHCEKEAKVLSIVGTVVSFECIVCGKQFAIVFDSGE